MRKNLHCVSFPVLFLALLALLLVTGCRTGPVYNVANSPVALHSQAHPDMAKIAKAITAAGTKLGWRMAQREPGHIVGTLHVRSHLAVVDIAYNHATYSITYKDSRNLKYDGAKIHSQYNNWIKNLDQAIQGELTVSN